MRVGRRNLITDVPGIVVGNASHAGHKTGTTVFTADKPFVASVDVMGGAPGTRETDCLAPENLVSDIDALVLSGGSAFGLDAASGVTDALVAAGRGYKVGPVHVPIVPAAIVFDLINGGEKGWDKNPYRDLGEQAFVNSAEHFELGSIGAGCGATTANLKGGLGSASVVLDSGATVGALVVVNPHGSVVVPGTDNVNQKLEAFQEKSNTTIAIVATDLTLDKAGCKRFATAAQDGMARAIVPSHTAYDGDLVFGVSTQANAPQDPLKDIMVLGHAGALCLTRAIARAVYHASEQPNDTLRTWQSKWKGRS